MKWVYRIVSHTALGFMALFLFNAAGAFVGLSVRLNLWNAAVAGLLGLPGFALLLVLQYLSL